MLGLHLCIALALPVVLAMAPSPREGGALGERELGTTPPPATPSPDDDTEGNATDIPDAALTHAPPGACVGNSECAEGDFCSQGVCRAAADTDDGDVLPIWGWVLVAIAGLLGVVGVAVGALLYSRSRSGMDFHQFAEDFVGEESFHQYDAGTVNFGKRI